MKILGIRCKEPSKVGRTTKSNEKVRGCCNESCTLQTEVTNDVVGWFGIISWMPQNYLSDGKR